MDANIDDDVPMQRAKYAATHYLPHVLLALTLAIVAWRRAAVIHETR